MPSSSESDHHCPCPYLVLLYKTGWYVHNFNDFLLVLSRYISIDSEEEKKKHGSCV